MSPLALKIRNYRGIRYRKPLRFDLEDGITFILGVNNVGKSSLLKLFSDLRPLVKRGLTTETTQNPFEYHPAVGDLYGDVLLNQLSEETELELELTMRGLKVLFTINPGRERHSTEYFVKRLIHATEVNPQERTKIRDEIARAFCDTMFVPPFRTTTRSNIKSHLDDVFLGEALVSQFAEWLTGLNVEHSRKMHELIDDLKSILAFQKFSLLPSNDKKHLRVVTEDGTFRLEDMGNGIGHFIVVLLNATFNCPGFILIDEPEVGLHPRMQQAFIHALASRARYGLIAASHSIGLARSVADRIFLAYRDDGLRLSPMGDYKPTMAQALHELGYSQFVDIGGDNILLVEGRTDIKVFQEILRKFGLDTSVIVWHLGGSSCINKDAFFELNEIKRLNAKSVTVIFDSERTSEGGALRTTFQDFVNVCTELGFAVFPTDRHSSESYITQEALDSEFGGRYVAVLPFEDFNKRSPEQKWGKNANWRLFNRMTRADLENTKLGRFLLERFSDAQSAQR